MAHDREIGGMWCREVLDHLPDYLDGEVDDETKARIEAHLHGCDWCERFGGQYAQTVGELRSLLATPAPVDVPMAKRLRARLSDCRPEDGQTDPETQ